MVDHEISFQLIFSFATRKLMKIISETIKWKMSENLIIILCL